MHLILAVPRVLVGTADVLLTFLKSAVLPDGGQRVARTNARWALHLATLDAKDSRRAMVHAERAVRGDDLAVVGSASADESAGRPRRAG